MAASFGGSLCVLVEEVERYWLLLVPVTVHVNAMLIYLLAASRSLLGHHQWRLTAAWEIIFATLNQDKLGS